MTNPEAPFRTTFVPFSGVHPELRRHHLLQLSRVLPTCHAPPEHRQEGPHLPVQLELPRQCREPPVLQEMPIRSVPQGWTGPQHGLDGGAEKGCSHRCPEHAATCECNLFKVWNSAEIKSNPIFPKVDITDR